jgi:hypothetical protein
MAIWAATVTDTGSYAGLPFLCWDGDTTYAEVRAFADRLGLRVDWPMTEASRIEGEYAAPLSGLDASFEASLAVMARINEEVRS